MDRLSLDQFGRYQALELMGEGAMARVYAAHDPAVDRRVALKLLKGRHSVDEEYRTRFLREARAAGALSHPNIVTIYDADEVAGVPFISMELVDAETLDVWIDRGYNLSVPKIVSIGVQLAEALDYAHERGVVHRDIKPSNVLYAKGTVKIADFGIARLATAEDASDTQVGTVLGTPRYMSPEQAYGRSVDARSDLFSVGVLLYELLAGRCAFRAESTTATLLQIAQGEPEPLRRVNPSLPVGLVKIVERLLQKKPEKRFQKGSDLAAALRRELRSLDEQAREHRRNKYVPIKYQWGAAIGLLVGCVLTAASYTTYTRQVEEMRRIAVDSGRSMARYVATQAAIQTLSEDWISLESFVEEASGRDSFEYLTIADRDGVVRAATNPALLGQALTLPGTALAVDGADDVRIAEFVLPAGPRVFDFSTAVTYQDVTVGRIRLGLSQERLVAATGAIRFFPRNARYHNVVWCHGCSICFRQLVATTNTHVAGSL